MKYVRRKVAQAVIVTHVFTFLQACEFCKTIFALNIEFGPNSHRFLQHNLQLFTKHFSSAIKCNFRLEFPSMKLAGNSNLFTFS